MKTPGSPVVAASSGSGHLARAKIITRQVFSLADAHVGGGPGRDLAYADPRDTVSSARLAS